MGQPSKSHPFGAHDVSLLESGHFADATVRCGSKTWKVHKFVVCGRSDWFRKALDGKFKETSQGIVVIGNFEPEQIDWLLKWIYSGRHDLKSLPGPHTTPIAGTADAYQIADYFLLEELKTVLVDTLWQDLVKIMMSMQLSNYRSSAQMLGQAPDDFYRDLFQGIHTEYQSPWEDSDFRNILLKFAIHTRHLAKANAKFAAGLLAEPRFAVDLAAQDDPATNSRTVSTQWNCDGCGKTFVSDISDAELQLQSCSQLRRVCTDCFINGK